MIMEIQFLDVVVVLAIIVSTAYATYRGFVDESLSIVSWVAEALAMLYFGPMVARMLRHVMSPDWLGWIVGYASVFLVVVIPLSFMTFRLSRNVKKSQVGPLDGSLGAAYGVVRGLAIIGVIYLIFSAIVPIPLQPGWVARARLLPLIRGSAEVIASLMPDRHLESPAPPPSPKAAVVPPENKVTPAPTHKTAAKPVKPAKKTAAKKHVKKTYGVKDRHALEKLIEDTDKGKSAKP